MKTWKEMTHQDYLNINPNLIKRLWMHKNRKGTINEPLYLCVYGIVYNLKFVKDNIIKVIGIKPYFPDGQFPHEALGLKIDDCR